MIQKIKDFFEFGKSEFRGVLMLIIILLILGMVNLAISTISKDSKNGNDQFKQEVASFEIRQQQLEDSVAKNKPKWKSYEREEVSFFGVDKSVMKNELNPFPFNPNNLSEDLWKKIGLTDKQVKSIKNFEAKGGKFKTKEDFKKMYAISSDEYSILEPFITIPVDTAQKYSPKKVKFAHQTVDLNSADSLELQKIPGIGEGLSRRIVTQRTKLGGFYSLNQLEEIYGIDSARFAKITPFLTLNTSKVEKININTADIKTLVKHPYLDLYMAKSIVVYRKKIIRYTSIAQIKQASLVYDELYEKLAPYLTIE